jgi:hypothetical protein
MVHLFSTDNLDLNLYTTPILRLISNLCFVKTLQIPS